MRLPVPPPRPNHEDECVGRRARREAGVGRTSLVALMVVALVGVAIGSAAAPARAQTPAPRTDPLAEADAEVTRLRQEADALSGRYFEALAELAGVQARIDDIEQRIPVLTAEVEDLRDRTRTRAVAAYKRSGNDLASVMSAEDPMDAARRVQWLSRLNERDGTVAADLRAVSAKLAIQRTELRTARESAGVALDQVRDQGQAIDALLVDAQARRLAAATPPPTAAAVPDPAATSNATVSRDGSTTTTTTAPKSTPPPAPPTYTPTTGTHPRHGEPFLVCTRAREASGNYAAYNPAGPYMGAYQFLQTTWNSAANRAGRPDLIGVPPHTASSYDQDDVAWALYEWQGSRPWGGHCDPE